MQQFELYFSASNLFSFSFYSIGQVTPDMLQGITYGTYILFGVLTYLGAAFVYFFVPETKRLTLEEMVRYLITSKPAKATILTVIAIGHPLWQRRYRTCRL